MDSDWLDTSVIFEFLDDAKAGKPQRLLAYVAESPLRCVARDYSSVVLVRSHASYTVGDDRWADLNSPAGPDGQPRQVVNLFQRLKTGGASWGKIAVPFARRLVAVRWDNAQYVLELENGEVRAPPQQLHRAIMDSSFTGLQQSEATIARNFGKVDGSVPIEHLGPPVDWAAVRAKLPPTIEDGVLGVLERGGEGMDFGTTIVALGRRLDVTVTVNEQGSWVTGLRRGASVVARLREYTAKAKDHAEKELLRLKNEDWLGDTEESLSSAEFQEHMNLSGLTFHDDGSVVFVFDDGESERRQGLFCGHAIVVHMGKDDQFTAAELFG